MYDYYFFDLDGTLTDPWEGITNSVAYALKRFGISVEDNKKLLPFIGPPLVDSFQEYVGLDRESAIKAVEYYREYFSDKGLYENKVYDGIIGVLKELKQRGKKLVVATSKPQIFTEKILAKFNLDRYFDYVSGASLDQSKIKKGDIIAHAIKELKIEDTSRVLMIGDRCFDIMGASQNSTHSAGVLYGYGSREEIENSNPNYIVDKVQDILKIESKT